MGFAKRPEMPAIWVSSGVWDSKAFTANAVGSSIVKTKVPKYVSKMLHQPWSDYAGAAIAHEVESLGKAYGMDSNLYPANIIKKETRDSPRMVCLTHAREDTYVPASSSD